MLIIAALIVLAAVFPGLAGNGQHNATTSLLTDAGRAGVRAEIRTQLPRWSGGAALPLPRSRLALVAGLQRLYAIAGETSEGVTGQVSVYDLTENRWQTAAEKPTPVSNVSGALIGDLIYVPGGLTEDGEASTVLESFDAQKGLWESRAALPEPRAAYALAAMNDRLYLFGGWDGNAYRSEVFVYDATTDTWSAATPMPEARGAAAAAAFAGLIYVAGGYNGEQELADVMAYDPATESAGGEPWSPLAPMSQARSGLAMTALGPRLYVLGGESAESYGEQYDIGTGAWSRFESPVAGEWRNLAAAAHGQSIYTVGGWSGDYLDINAAYEAVIRLLLPFGSKGE
jgi:Kelch motif